MHKVKPCWQVVTTVEMDRVKKSVETVEDSAEKKVEIVTPLGPLPAKRWEMESKVKMANVSIADVSLTTVI